jgi:hypothetical protein
MSSLFICRAARIVGPAAMLWIVPASAADLAVTACESVSAEVRSAVSGKKALTTARIASVLRSSVQRDKAASSQGDHPTSSGERNTSDVWYRRQFVLLVGVGY